MAAEGINYQVVLEDLKAKRAQLDAAIAAIEAILGIGPMGAPAPGQAGAAGITHDAFFSMSIPDATKKLLTMLNRRISTPDIQKYLKQGGLPEPAYNTLYAVLRRRQNQIGDIININGEWGLKQWAPNYKPPTKTKKADEATDADADDSVDAEPDQEVTPEAK